MADKIDIAKDIQSLKFPPRTGLPDEQAIGAASMLCYIRDLITASGKDSYDRPTLLVLLETISRDPELFPLGLGVQIWNLDDEGTP